MEVNINEQKRAGRLLKTLRVDRRQIKSFSFMQRPLPIHSQKGGSSYGPGILTLHLQEGQAKTVCLTPRRHPSSVIRYLISQEIPFDNHTPQERTVAELPVKTYRRPSLYMFWFFILFFIFLLLGFYATSAGNRWWGLIPAIISFSLSLFLISTLLTRFCYLTLTNEALVIHSVGRSVRYPYRSLRKVNFDFARELNFTHVMELLDNHYRYRLFYIGRVPRKKLNEISEQLRQAGIDATCSLNENKRFFQDTYVNH